MIHATDVQWEKFGDQDPFYGVVSHEEYRGKTLDHDSMDKFLQTGEQHVELVLSDLRQHFGLGDQWRPSRGLDFGCGVGRLIVPLARRCEQVVGVDISPSMLRRAGELCREHGVDNVSWAVSDDELREVSGQFDLIHSFIVFQHMHPKRGTAIFRKLLSHLAPGGVAMCQFTYARRGGIRKFSQHVKSRIPLANHAINLVRGRRFDAPHMQMHRYRLSELFDTVRDAGITSVASRMTDHGGELGVMMYVQRHRD